MKRFTLLLILIVSNVKLLAQNGFEYHQFSIGTGIGTTTAFGNTGTKVSKYAYNANVNYNVSPFLEASLEVQTGTLAGGLPTDFYARSFENGYMAIIFHVDIQAGEIFDYSHSDVLNGLKNFYVGTGIGVLNNNITYIQTAVPPGTSNLTVYPYLPTSTNILVPLRTGYEFKIYNGYDQPQYRIDLGFSFYTALGKGLDGYTSLSSVKFYNYFNIGFKIGLGSTTTYRKPVPYYGL